MSRLPNCMFWLQDLRLDTLLVRRLGLLGQSSGGVTLVGAVSHVCPCQQRPTVRASDPRARRVALGFPSRWRSTEHSLVRAAGSLELDISTSAIFGVVCGWEK